MYEGRSVVAIVPARGGSKGLPQKNIRVLCGRPLIEWSILHGLSSRYVDRVVVTTDSLEIAEIARRAGAEVPFLRPPELALDSSPSSGAIIHCLDYLKSHGDLYDYFVLLEPTSPLREVNDVDRCIERLISNREARAIVSVAPLESVHPVFDVVLSDEGFIKPYGTNQESFQVLRRQDLPKAFFLDGTMYGSKTTTYRELRTVLHDRTLGYVVPRWKSYEVDDVYDFVMIEALMSFRQTLAPAGDAK